MTYCYDDDDDFDDEKMKSRNYKLIKKSVSAKPGSNQQKEKKSNLLTLCLIAQET